MIYTTGMTLLEFNYFFIVCVAYLISPAFVSYKWEDDTEKRIWMWIKKIIASVHCLSCSVFISVGLKNFTRLDGNNFKALIISYYKCVSASLLKYAACKSHLSYAALYCQLWSVQLQHIFFSNYLIKVKVLKKSYQT